ncbi:MAG: hypothetical protein ACYCZF_12215 [Anaerolineae bacterium]
MLVRQVALDHKKDIGKFIAFPFNLYRGNALWVPPMWNDMRRVLDPAHHPFYQHSEAGFFIAENAGDVCGRIAVLAHRRFNAIRRQQAAFFYYFDVIDDRKVAMALLEVAFNWARERNLECIIGPKGFLQADGHGILVEGYEHRPAVGIPYNYPYYEKLLLAGGFTKETDYYSGYITREQGLPQRYFQAAEQVRLRRGYTVKTFNNKDELRVWIPRIGHIYREAFTDHWEFCPPTDDEMRMIGDRLLAIADPRLIKVVMKGDEVIGFVFAFPDVSEGIRRSGGKLWPFGWLHLMQDFKRTQWVDFNGVGILKPYQGTGANAVLYAELTRALFEYQYQYGEYVQVEERNVKSLGESKALDVHWFKRHRVYRRSL